jgi:hypothetical protein
VKNIKKNKSAIYSDGKKLECLGYLDPDILEKENEEDDQSFESNDEIEYESENVKIRKKWRIKNNSPLLIY